MRDQLNIPKNAKVFGGYGGKYSFSIKFVYNVVYEVAKNNPDKNKLWTFSVTFILLEPSHSAILPPNKLIIAGTAWFIDLKGN